MENFFTCTRYNILNYNYQHYLTCYNVLDVDTFLSKVHITFVKKIKRLKTEKSTKCLRNKR